MDGTGAIQGLTLEELDSLFRLTQSIEWDTFLKYVEIRCLETAMDAVRNPDDARFHAGKHEAYTSMSMVASIIEQDFEEKKNKKR